MDTYGGVKPRAETDKAQSVATQFGFNRATADWRDLLADPTIHIISITTPNGMYRKMTMAALASGKHVWCEKLMALTLDDARQMEAAAGASGLKTQLEYNDTANPARPYSSSLWRGSNLVEGITTCKTYIDFLADMLPYALMRFRESR
ncbi:Gfo/Idh/MocA family oxidoreductase [Pseudotabrizicola sp. 4114]|uniref:Gfo/Idh/MocA family protein n=1 Tax=Pseudotabrizicola sp. 4114 TaxID=2817731 RepID=UPI002858A7F5|nr:hypothetical protein [Pseudorhodobacter sp. 4114]